MAVEVVEVVSGVAASLVSPQTISIAGTPVPDDAVFVTLSSRGSRVITAVSGLGASWRVFYSNADATNGSQSIWVGTGATSAGSMSVTIGGTTSEGQLAAFLVRGIPNPGPTQGSTATSSTLTSSNTVTANDTEIVLGVNYNRAGPLAGFAGTPAGWVAQPVASIASTASFQTAYLIPTSTGPASYSFTGSGTFRTASIVRAFPATQVTASRSTSWLQRQRVTAATATSWLVIGRITATRLTRWEVTKALTTPAFRSTIWMVESDIPRPPASVLEWHAESFVLPTSGVAGVDLPFVTEALPGDFVIAILAISGAVGGHIPAVSGLGATYTLTKQRTFSSNDSFYLYVGVGAAGAGVIRTQFTSGGIGRTCRGFAMVVRGLLDSTFYYEQASSWSLSDYLNIGSSFNYTAPAGPDTLILGVTLPTNGIPSYPSAATSPGFTTDVANYTPLGPGSDWLGVSWQAFDVATTPNAVTLGVTAVAAAYMPIVVYWIGGPPGVRGIDTFEETLTQQDLTDARLDGAGTDVAVIGTSLFSSDSDFVEVATKTQNVLVASSAYTEVPSVAPATLQMASLQPEALWQALAQLQAAATYVEVLVTPFVEPEPTTPTAMHGWGLVIPGRVEE